MNCLYYGDNLDILRADIRDESIDLIYLDPPFNSQATYNVLFHAPTGERSQAQIEAFEDTWHWNETAERAFDEVVQSGNTEAAGWRWEVAMANAWVTSSARIWLAMDHPTTAREHRSRTTARYSQPSPVGR